MTSLSVTAKTLAGGAYAPGKPISLELLRGLSSPAANLTAAFAVRERPPEIRELTITYDNTPLFTGKADLQEISFSGAGMLLTVEARDNGAGPLDNEAEPRAYWGANLTTMFTRLVKPYGFALYNTYPSRTLPVYTVHKGTSEWDAFQGYVRLLHGVSAHAEGGLVVIGPPRAARGHVFSNTEEGGIRYRSLVHRRMPYEMISKLYLRDPEGYYSSSMTDPAAVAGGVERARYLIPATEYAGNPGLDARMRISQARYDSMELILECPGLIPVSPGDGAAVADSAFRAQSLLADEVRLLTGEDGVITRIILKAIDN